MLQSDLKLERASVHVSNANQTSKVYSIEADFCTVNNELKRVEGGFVTKEGEHKATFFKNYEGSNDTTTYTFYGTSTKEEKLEIMELVEDFEAVAEAVALAEVNE